MKKLSVVIPALNEESGIADIVERVLAVRPALAAQEMDLELIVVDDGSSDRTAQIVAGYSDVVLVQHSTNCGYGAALKTGFAQAQGEWLGFLDADGTYPPEHFPALLKAGRAQDAELVMGKENRQKEIVLLFAAVMGIDLSAHVGHRSGGSGAVVPVGHIKIIHL